MKPISIDGARGEGGGQILRSALTLALLTGKSFRLNRIRAGRPRPGLQPQHLACVEAAAAIAPGTRFRGASLHSVALDFEPGAVVAGRYDFRIGTAGSTGLVLQTVFLPLALADGPSTVRIAGGTHVRASPCYDFLDRTWHAYLKAIGYRWNIGMIRPGFYPRGGGRIEASLEGIRAEELQGLPEIDPKAGSAVHGRAITAGLPAGIGHRLAERAEALLGEAGVRSNFVTETWPGGPGALLLLEMPSTPAPTLFLGLGEKGKPAERVAEEVVAELLEHRRSATPGVDSHSADQLLLPLAMVPGETRYPTVKVTRHLLTNIEITSLFLDRELRCLGLEGHPGWIEIGRGS